MIPALTLPAISIGLGLSANAYFFFGNLCASQVGSVTLISKPEERKKLGLGAGVSAQVFDSFYHRAAKRFASASVISAVSYMTVAYLQRNTASTLSTRLYIASGLLSLFPGPWTLLVMMPTNERLMAKAKAQAEGSAAVNEKSSVDEFEQDITKWVAMNSARILVMGISYALSLYNVLVL